jgi:tRNA-2-methylthio-N6-dimethylallyladenosine synthase
MNRVFIKTYGCQMNERDSEAVAAMLQARGYRLAENEDECDILLLNTCSVRDLAEQKALGKAGHLAAHKRRHRRPLILGILGCMAQNRGAELLDRLPDLDLIVGTQKFHHVPAYLDHLRAARAEGRGNGVAIVDIAEEAGSQNALHDHLVASRSVTAFVSIQQGCDMACAFCIVPKTRGDERSRPIDDIVAECRELASRGVREITLLGQIVTSYGRRGPARAGGRTPFVQLLERLHEVDGLARLRFTSPHPCGFRPDLVEAYGRLPRLCPYVHLPVQSGSNRILRAMNRPYTRERYLELVAALRAVRSDMHFSTDVIVGFPGETAEDFAETQALFATADYDMAYIFKYSTRTGTPAAAMPGQVPEETKEERNQVLLRLLERNSRRRNQALVGTTQEVLVEGPDRRGLRYLGRTPGNRTVHFAGAASLIGRLLPVRIERATTSVLYGAPVGVGVES